MIKAFVFIASEENVADQLRLRDVERAVNRSKRRPTPKESSSVEENIGAARAAPASVDISKDRPRARDVRVLHPAETSSRRSTAHNASTIVARARAA